MSQLSNLRSTSTPTFLFTPTFTSNKPSQPTLPDCQPTNTIKALRAFQKLKRNCYCSTLLLRHLLCHVIDNIIILLGKIFTYTYIQQLPYTWLCSEEKKVIRVQGSCPTHITRWTRWTHRHFYIINQWKIKTKYCLYIFILDNFNFTYSFSFTCYSTLI